MRRQLTTKMKLVFTSDCVRKYDTNLVFRLCRTYDWRKYAYTFNIAKLRMVKRWRKYYDDPFFNFLLQSFAPCTFSDAVWNADSEYFISFFFNTQTVELAGLLKFKFWSILPVFVILCGVQSTRWSSHLIRAKYCLFTSLSCVNHIFLPNSLRTTTICIWRFPSAMHNGLAGWYRCPEVFGGCARLLVQEQ